MRKAIFFDRDGVICENRDDYVKGWDEFQFLPGAMDALQRISPTSFLVIVVTNQSAINQGLVTRQTVEGIHEKMISEVKAKGGRIDAVYYCPHTPVENCPCRKPKPGLLLAASKDLEIDLTRSFMVGDKLSDLDAGHAAGCAGILVLSGKGGKQDLSRIGKELVIVKDMYEAVTVILSKEAPG
jgi:D-glycero-D-manno-heptose 1,7-bisphosphate phosphatase